MKKLIFLLSFFLSAFNLLGQDFQTPFEKSNENETATYFQCIEFYKKLAARYSAVITIRTCGLTDAGYPLHLVIFNSAGKLNRSQWKEDLRILINNGIHPGEPDGIDASMMLIRDAASGKIKIPANVVLAVIPVYNIGGALNRNSFSRVNQEGPVSYGFRGNAQNLDLNRDFTKCDSRNAQSFAEIFHFIDPEIFVDNHVSDGADYQHTMTLLTTQHNKLGGPIGNYLHEVFEPAIYSNMEKKNWPLTPYVNFYSADPDKG
ncbi:MAG TPA: M14 family zinc carboxypeptidase, partial [Chitinophagaceae bacterium]